MKSFIVYTAESGEILRTGEAPDDMLEIQVAAGEALIEGRANDVTQYIVAGAVTDKPAMGAAIDKTSVLANGAEVATLSNVATGATVSVSGPVSITGVGDGTPVELTFESVGRYTITVQHFPDLDFTAVIDAT